MYYGLLGSIPDAKDTWGYMLCQLRITPIANRIC